ncbi:hypothetical protein FLJC2902T_00340 [Flavobacterium limnosediminis JC2902]|uniref:Uncharacterized protein n=1 Tax=Flavobacterium limnosediminis JC2902 TaxID=1341181 RepID=V6STR2_9FLAO|nr:hypothetical protein [Flavobacterium limnosediminis]ESU29567.1 hypothetical protein FLJC2902T_00340 [Flavobacterium limnosediminis JC2902]
MKKALLLFTVVFCFAQGSFGQFKFPKNEDWVVASQLPLVVVLEERNPEKIEKLTKNEKFEELKMYNSSIDAYNTYIKKYVEMYWDKNLIHGFMTEKEYAVFEKNKENKRKFIFIKPKYNNNHSKATSYYLANGKEKMNANHVNNTQILFGMLGGGFTATQDALSSKSFPDIYHDFLKTFTAHIFKESDLKIAVNLFKKSMDDIVNAAPETKKLSSKEQVKWINRNAGNVKQLILLVDETKHPESFLREFKAKYKYKYEIVTEERIDHAILNNEDGYACFHNQFFPSMSGTNYNLVQVYETKSLTALYCEFPKSFKIESDAGDFIEAVEMQ